MRRLLAMGFLLSLVFGFAPAGAQDREIGDTRVFTMIGQPGMPEGLAVRDGIVYVSTHASIRSNAGDNTPSKIFKFDLSGAPVGEIVAAGQDLTKTHGLLAMAFDAAGRLYVADRNPARVARVDLTTGTWETYGTIPDLAACRPVIGPKTGCAPVTVDEPAFPDYIAFDAAGNMYVTDLQAATIFRIPPGGGAAQIWFQDARLDGIFGPNGIAVDPTGTKLYFAMTGSQQPASLAQGIIYTLPISESPGAGDMETVFVYTDPAAGPDGIRFGASGRLYVALAGSNQLSILDGSTEVARFPDAVSNATCGLPLVYAPPQTCVPYDLPASIGFDGKGSVLLTNQSFFAANPDHWAVLDVWVNDTALALIEPAIP